MKCSVSGCWNNSSSPRGKSFFSFPKQKNLAQIWLEAIGRPEYIPKKWHVVCEDHFLESNIIRLHGRNCLSEGAVPYLHLEKIQPSSSSGMVPAKEVVAEDVKERQNCSMELLESISEMPFYIKETEEFDCSRRRTVNGIIRRVRPYRNKRNNT